MKKSGLFTKGAALLLVAGLMTGCGSDDDSGSNVKTGTFEDAFVVGISYYTSTQEGVTDANGTFKYKAGETVTFYIGDIELPGGVPQDGYITPAHLAGTADWDTDDTAINIIRFLLTLDEDGDASNGIQIPEGAADWADAPIDFTNTDAFNTAADAYFAALDLDAEIDFTYTTIVSSGTAITHFQATLDEIGIDIEIQISTEVVACTAGNTEAIAGLYTTGALVGTITDTLDVNVSGTSLTIDTDDAITSCTFAQSEVTVLDEKIITSTWIWIKPVTLQTYTISLTSGVKSFTVVDGSDVGTGTLSLKL